MKLIREKRLHFQQGKSDKIYEVELCEVGDNEYLVNFRYGRRGGTLNEGTKTNFPVELEKAEKLFEKLINDKTKKGYIDVSAASIKEQLAIIEEKDIEYASPEAARKGHILKHLELAANSLDLQASKNWDIKRVIWRAGELKIAEASPFLIKLATLSQLGKKKNDLFQYVALWAIGRCAPNSTLKSETLDYIDTIFSKERVAPMILRIAREAYRAIAEGDRLTAFLNQIKSSWASNIQEAVDKDDYKELLSILQSAKGNAGQHQLFTEFYLFYPSKPMLRKAFNLVLQQASIKAGQFRFLRQLYKMAEFRLDGQVFGILAYKIEKQAALFKMPDGENPGIYYQYKYLYPKEELKKENPKVAFSEGTKKYFGKRTRRTLHRLGSLKDPSYVYLATGILLRYDDEKDGKTARVSKNWKFDKEQRRYKSTVSYYDSYSKELLFNQLLYANSERFAYSEDLKEWVCINNYEPGDEIPEQKREEAYPELWDQAPNALVHLLMEAKSEKVTDFALRTLQKNSAYQQILNRFDIQDTIHLLNKPYSATSRFALLLAKRQYEASTPHQGLILAMMNHQHADIRNQALEWIEASYFIFFTETDFVRDILTHTNPQIRIWAKEQFHRIADLYDSSKRKALIGRLLGYCLRQATEAQLITELQGILFQYFGENLSQISLDVIGDLLSNKITENQLFAAELLKNHSIDRDRIPTEQLQLLIHHQQPQLSEIGLELLAGQSDINLAKQQEFLLKLLVAKKESIRKAIKAIIDRLAERYDDFAKSVLGHLIKLLLRKETYEGLHQEIFLILTSTLEQQLNIVDRKMIFRLLNANHVKAQELACILMDRYIPFESMSVRNIIRLADHEIKAARELAWKMFRTQVPRIRYEREEALRLLDSNWEDSRQFAFDFFKATYTETDWNPELLVGICDSVRTDVQAFGRNLITRFFKEEDGTEYLLKLSQHPKPELQLFVTNYLSRYAADNPHNIKKLEIYFTTVLTQVNKGRVAKDRILHFLHQEALKSYEVAELVARVLGFVSATFAIGDKFKCIEIMRDLIQLYPVLEMPIQIAAIPEYSK